MFSEEALSNGASDTEIKEIEAILGHSFSDPSHLLNALTRRSFWHENRETCREHNERLEFLGDAVLGLVIVDILYLRIPRRRRGRSSRRKGPAL